MTRCGVLIALVMGVSQAAAGPVDQLNVQGRLSNQAGIVVDGSYNLVISLYATQTGGQSLWDDAFYDVKTHHGVFSVVLGANEPIPISVFESANELWFQVKVNNDPPLPRRPVYASATSILAKAAKSLMCSGCVSPQHLALVGQCGEGDILQFSAKGLVCSSPEKFQVDESMVDQYVSNNGYALSASLAPVALSGLYSELEGTPKLSPVATSGKYTDLSGTPVLSKVATTGEHADLANAPVLANVATSGQYKDLVNPPKLATIATTGAYADLSGKPAFAKVATSGAYGDLVNTPKLANVATSGDYNALVGKPSLSKVAGTGDYADLKNTPKLKTIATSGSFNDLNDVPSNIGVSMFANKAAMKAVVKPGSIGFRVDEGIFYLRTNKAWKTVVTKGVCGDGDLDIGELCDDGNTNDGDGCSGVCTWCGDGICDTAKEESFASCMKDCPKPPAWLKSNWVTWYPIKFPYSVYKESLAIKVCKAAKLRLWRDQTGDSTDADYVYDVDDNHNLGGHDIGYKVEAACNNNQQSHTGQWQVFGKAWSEQIKTISGASNGQTVYIVNKYSHSGSYENACNWTKVSPSPNGVAYGSAGSANPTMERAIVLCASRP